MKHMRFYQKHSFWLTGLLLILGFTFAVNYGYYTKASAGERGNASITVSPGNLHRADPLVFAPDSLGQPKQWVQPGKILARYTIKNAGKEPLPTTVLAQQFPGPVMLQAGAATFEKPTGRLSRLIAPGQTLRVNVSIDLSTVTPRQHLLGELQVIDASSGAVLGITPVHLTNSQIQQTTGGDTSHDASHHRQGDVK